MIFQAGNEVDVEEYLRRKYEGLVKKVVRVSKEDLEIVRNFEVLRFSRFALMLELTSLSQTIFSVIDELSFKSPSVI